MAESYSMLFWQTIYPFSLEVKRIMDFTVTIIG